MRVVLVALLLLLLLYHCTMPCDNTCYPASSGAIFCLVWISWHGPWRCSDTPWRDPCRWHRTPTVHCCCQYQSSAVVIIVRQQGGGGWWWWCQRGEDDGEV